MSLTVLVGGAPVIITRLAPFVKAQNPYYGINLMNTIDSITKLANEFEAVSGGLFEGSNWRKEGEKLAMIAGKVAYQAQREKDVMRADSAKRAAMLALRAADILKSL